MTAYKGSFLLVAVALLACSCASTGLRSNADSYLADPHTSEVVKTAIRNGVVVLGMCPLQTIAAAGDPGPYRVEPDPTRWPDDADPVKVVEVQCKHPDRSVIELTFSNTSQFDSHEPVVFRVRFVDGRAAQIAVQGFADQDSEGEAWASRR